MTWNGQAFQIEIIRIDAKITFQESRIGFLQRSDFALAGGQVLRSLAIRIFQLPYVFRHQRTSGVVGNLFFRRVVGERIKLAAEGLAFTERAAGGPEMGALGLDADAAETTGFFFRQRYLERRITGLDVTALSAFGAMIKRHARSRRNRSALAAWRRPDRG